MGIVEFLRARLDEDEAVARAGISSQADPENGWGYGGAGSPRALTPHVGVIHERVQAEHIIRWHPARVLREVEARRRIVDEVACGHFDSDYDSALPHLASVYSDHPDYDPDWTI